MDLIDQITSTALNPEYARDAQRRAAAGGTGRTTSARVSRGAGHVVTILICAFVGVVLAAAGITTANAAHEASHERQALIDAIGAAESRNADQRGQLTQIRDDVAGLQRRALADQHEMLDRLNAVQLAVGDTNVRGPGMTISLTDGPADDEDAQVVDEDLRIIVNGLWQSGAEAVSINGHRITARTAIHDAGSAITVDYRSVSSPYTIEAIGDSHAMTGAFASTPASSWLAYLRDNHQIRYTTNISSTLQLEGDPEGSADQLQRRP
ncbi:conserved protein [Propionibacterium freudenreichii subsp. shermanii]|nr:conserved protein [Propionibacterium freudenreichii subsp. shermanii]SPB31625.1 hypothetical protein MAJHIDBO_01855 [Propionibacterium freudenreichii subsp. shermanii]SPS09640.1 hypothetical protein MAJHIDBO_01855 [Propionibacterium freudenreichii subsp. shermanii]